MSSLSLVGVEVEVGVGVEVEDGFWAKMQVSFLTFSVWWVGGVVGEVKYKTNLNSSCS